MDGRGVPLSLIVTGRTSMTARSLPPSRMRWRSSERILRSGGTSICVRMQAIVARCIARRLKIEDTFLM